MDSKTKLQKHSLKHSKTVSKYTKNTIDFIFNDESRISVELSFLKKYPTSLLSLTVENSANYLQDEDAYYIDSSRYSVDSLILYMEGKISLESLPMNEVCEIRDAADYFFGNDIIDIKDKIEAVLQSFLNIFMKQNDFSIEDELYEKDTIKPKLSINGVITKERNEKFQEYSRLFEVLNIKRVQVEFDFSEDIPYEYIYPSNLHELFPKLEEYEIKFKIIKLTKEICLNPSDPKYTSLYKTYKLYCYEKYYPEAYNAYISTHPDIEPFSFPDNNNQIYTSTNLINCYYQEDETVHHEIIPIDIDEEIKNENDDEKPDLYLYPVYEYILNNQEQESVNNNNEIDTIKTNDFISYTFLFLEENGQLNTSHPTLYHKSHELPCSQIDNYLLKLPIFKQLRNYRGDDFSPLLKGNISLFLKLLSEGLLDGLEIMTLNYFINSSSYDEYVQLFNTIIKTHVFPNVKKLEIYINDQNDPNIPLYQEILTLITRNNFPKLSIYTINYGTNFKPLEDTLNIDSILIPTSLIKLVDIIYLCTEYKCSFHLDEFFINTIYQVKQYHEFKIQSDLNIDNYNEFWTHLFDSKIIVFNALNISLCETHTLTHDYSFDLSHYTIKCLNIDINFQNDSFDKMNKIQNLLQTINTTHLKEIHFTFNSYEIKGCLKFFNILLPILHNKYYDNVTKLDININDNYRNEYPNENQMLEINELLLEFFSLFTNNMRSLHLCNVLYTQVHDIDNNSLKIFNNISVFINKKKLVHLQSIILEYPFIFFLAVDRIKYKNVYSLIKAITNCSSDSLPCLEQFNIYDEKHSTISLFNAFPSLYFDHHMTCYNIKMNYTILYDNDAFVNYSEYIYNELQKPYTKGITSLYLYIVDHSYLKKFVDLIINDSFLYLNKLTINIAHCSEKIDINDYMPLLNNYKEKINNNLNISIVYSEPNDDEDDS
ncbi:hypothetical protein WA158_005963 [Blastocystis sp. Blastoise]